MSLAFAPSAFGGIIGDSIRDGLKDCIKDTIKKFCKVKFFSKLEKKIGLSDPNKKISDLAEQISKLKKAGADKKKIAILIAKLNKMVEEQNKKNK